MFWWFFSCITFRRRRRHWWGREKKSEGQLKTKMKLRCSSKVKFSRLDWIRVLSRSCERHCFEKRKIETSKHEIFSRYMSTNHFFFFNSSEIQNTREQNCLFTIFFKPEKIVRRGVWVNVGQKKRWGSWTRMFLIWSWNRREKKAEPYSMYFRNQSVANGAGAVPLEVLLPLPALRKAPSRDH